MFSLRYGQDDKFANNVNIGSTAILLLRKMQKDQFSQSAWNIASQKNIRILLISELSRLGRNVDEVLKNVMLCKENKLNVYFQKENLSIFDDSGKEHPFLTIFIAILGTVAQMERDNINSVLIVAASSTKEAAANLAERPAIANRKKKKQSCMQE